jgi:predicted nucleotidyltransferase
MNINEDKTTDIKIVKSFHVKDTLSKKIFNVPKNIMKDKIREQLLIIADDFIEFLGVDFYIHDVILTGSLANYNWSEYSDADLHILIDFDETNNDKKLLKEFFDTKKNLWNNNHNVKVKNYDVEVYVQNIHEKHISSGVYSILHNHWIIEPDKVKYKIDKRKILQKGDEFMSLIDDLIKKSKKNLDVMDNVIKLKKKIKNFRQIGLDNDGEYSYENLTFKLLRRNNYIEKLFTLDNDLTDKKLTIKQ